MAQIESNAETLKQAVKVAIYEQREFLYEVFAEVLEDFALSEAIREGRKTTSIARDEVMGIL